ncbi:MAG: DUF167 domain-containing protein [Gammaproteobacteria bacterium]|nr:DUF167 domain-containing protein [Gammaproteobacteria bacterium]
MKTIQIKVKPNARVSVLEEITQGVWLARLKSRPVEGKANAELITLVARHFKCHKSAIAITHGTRGCIKQITIE